MAAPTNVYVDPAIAANSGSGTIGDPYGDLQYALNTKARDATNGDQFNIKAGSDEILAASLSRATYGVPTYQAPLIFRGYAATAKDGGQGGINGNGSSIMSDTSGDYIHWYDLHIHNSGANRLLNLRNGIECVNCHFENTGAVDYGIYAAILFLSKCRLDNMAANYGLGSAVAAVSASYFGNGAMSFGLAAAIPSSRGSFTRNIVNLNGAQRGIVIAGDGLRIAHNAFFSTAGTFPAIQSNVSAAEIVNNLIEGFSGVGGCGIWAQNADGNAIIAGNACFNCTDPYGSLGDQDDFFYEDNETLDASPFAKSGAASYANRFAYFAPAAAVQGTAWPTGSNLDKGTVQHADLAQHRRRLHILGV